MRDLKIDEGLIYTSKMVYNEAKSALGYFDEIIYEFEINHLFTQAETIYPK